MALTKTPVFTFNHADQADKLELAADVTKANFDSRAKQLKDYIDDTLTVEVDAAIAKKANTEDIASTDNGKGASLVGLEDAGGNFTATDVEGAMAELFQSVSDGKTLVATAITDKGISTDGSDTFATMAGNIDSIVTDVPSTGTAAVTDVLAGKTFDSALAGDSATGTMTERGVVTFTPSNIEQAVSEGHYKTGSKVSAVTFDASKLLTGTTVAGTAGTMPAKTAATITPSTANQTIAAGQYLSGAQTILGDADLIAPNIVIGKDIYGVAGSAVKNPMITYKGVHFIPNTALYNQCGYLPDGSLKILSYFSNPRYNKNGLVTESAIDLTSVNTITLTASVHFPTDTHYNFQVSTVQHSDETVYNASVSNQNVLDVSSLSGNFYVKIIAYADTDYANSNCYIQITGIV